MSPESDLLFAQSDTLLLSDFNNLTEFEDFPKDLFLSNAMEGMAGGSLLEELDCKDALKHLLISDLNNAFSASLRDDDEEKQDVQSPKALDSPFTIFMDNEPLGPMGLMAMASKVELPTPDVSSIKDMGLTSLSRTLPSGCSGQGDLLSPRTILATNKMDCMSLDELDVSQLDSTDALSTLSVPLQQGRSLVTQGNAAEPVPTLPPLSPLGKAPKTRSLFSRTTHVSCSAADTITPSVLPIKPPITSPSMGTTISTSDGGSLLNMMLRHEERSNMHILKGTNRQSMTDLKAFTECSSLSKIQSPKGDGFVSCHSAIPLHVMQESSRNPTIQRSQSSHALGQLRNSSCLGPGTDEFSVLPVSKMEMSPSSAFNVSPSSQYQASNTQGSAARSSSASIRRVYSTGDLQVFNGIKNFYGGNLENINTEETAGLKIGQYTVEERKMKLHRYRQKRTERNFSKKIKYACRKTLADSRPRVRGRFARTDEMEEPTFRDNDLPLMDEYEDTSRRPRLIPEEALLLANNSCIMSNNTAARFWSVVGMKVAM